MSIKPLVNLGALANDGTGTPLRTGGTRINALVSATYVATASQFGGATKEATLTATIAAAAADGVPRVQVPDRYDLDGSAMRPYDASLVTFNPAVQMMREGQLADVYDVAAYGAVADNATDNTAAFVGALAGAATTRGTVWVPKSTSIYKIGSTLVLPTFARLEGGGSAADAPAPQITFTNTAGATLFSFTGTSESQPFSLTLRNLQFFGAGQANNCIGLRLRNFDGLTIDHCDFNHWTVAIWLDWGQFITIRNARLVLNTRAIQLGGNLSQTATPVPGAGIRGGPGTQFLDAVLIDKNSFSQNEIDINDIGSTQAYGFATISNNYFFESGSSPVASKSRYVTVTERPNLTFLGNTVESPNATRTALFVGAFDYDGNAGGISQGVAILGNTLGMNNGTGAVGVDVERATGAAILGNTIRVISGGSSVHLKLGDTTSSTYVGKNSYCDGSTSSPPFKEITPTFTITGTHYGFVSTRAGAATFGQLTITDATIAQAEFQLAGVRQAGFNVIGVDQIRVYNSAGTVKGYLGAAYASAQVNMGTGSSFTPACQNGNSFVGTANAAATVNAPTNVLQVGQRITVTIIQDGTGGRTVTWNAVFKVSWSDTGNTLNKRSSVSFIWDGTNWNQDGAQTPYV